MLVRGKDSAVAMPSVKSHPALRDVTLPDHNESAVIPLLRNLFRRTHPYLSKAGCSVIFSVGKTQEESLCLTVFFFFLSVSVYCKCVVGQRQNKRSKSGIVRGD